MDQSFLPVPIPMRSITSELSHVFTTLPIFNGWFIIPYALHLHRYITHLDVAVEIQKKQFTLPLVLLNILDWYIIYLVTFQGNKNFLFLGVISGLISWYFVYDAAKRVQMPPTSVLHSEFIDTVVIVILLVASYNTTDLRILFFICRDLVFHILKRLFAPQSDKN